MQVKVRRIGNGLGLLLPRQVLDRLQLEEGSVLTIVDTEDGVQLSPYDASFSEQIEAFRRTEGEHRNSYRELAK
jgi:putative addiction module antidote